MKGGRAPSWSGAITRSDLPSSPKLVALVLDTFLNRQTETAWPSLHTLATRTSLSKATVTRALKQLETEGWVDRVQRTRKNGSDASTLYRPRIPAKALLAESDVRETLSGVSPRDTPSETPVSPRDTLNLRKRKVSPYGETDVGGTLNSVKGPTEESRSATFAALASVWGADLKTMTPAARGRIGKAAKNLWLAGIPADAVHDDGSPYTLAELVLSLGSWFKRMYPNTECTPQTVEREYPRFCSGEFQAMAAAAEDEREERAAVRRKLNGR